MRLYEISSPQRRVEVTKRFLKDFSEFSKGNLALKSTLKDFIDFRKSALPTEPYGKKDYPFSNGNLKGWRHFHLEQGRIVLIYRITPSALLLTAVVDHKSIDGMKPTIAKYLVGIDASDFKPVLGATGAPAHRIPPEVKNALHELIYDLAGDPPGRKILQDSLNGNLIDVMTFVRMVQDDISDDSQKDQIAMTVFDGVEGLKAFIKNALNQTNFDQ